MASNPTSAEYEHVCDLRRAFDRRKDQTVPYNFSFVRPGQLAGMGLPINAAQIKLLETEHNVGMVVSLIESKNCPPPSLFEGTSVRHLWIEWRDMGKPTPAQVRAIVDATKAVIEQKKAVVYHCFAGRGRTGTALAAYLILIEKYDAESAIKEIRRIRPDSIETVPQEDFLRDLAIRREIV